MLILVGFLITFSLHISYFSNNCDHFSKALEVTHGPDSSTYMPAGIRVQGGRTHDVNLTRHVVGIAVCRENPLIVVRTSAYPLPFRASLIKMRSTEISCSYEVLWAAFFPENELIKNELLKFRHQANTYKKSLGVTRNSEGNFRSNQRVFQYFSQLKRILQLWTPHFSFFSNLGKLFTPYGRRNQRNAIRILLLKKNGKRPPHG